MTRKYGSTVNTSLQGLFQDKEALKEFISATVNELMQAEVEEHIQAGRYERTEDRLGHRNGTKPRRFKTRVGELDLQVPQVRGTEPYHPSLFARWERSERALLVACAEMYFQGVSTRNVRNVLDEMCGFELSASVVSRVAAELDEKLSTFRTRRLDAHEYRNLIIDARYENIRKNGRVVRQAVLITSGINEQGSREILDWRVGDSESEDTWGEVFRSLKDRGLKGVELVVSDAHKGIIKAMSRHMQGVEWQRCRVHFKRELLKKVSWKDAKELMSDLNCIFNPEEKQECMVRAEEVSSKWDARGADRVAKAIRDGVEDCLTVCSLPSSHRRRLNSTNMIERLMRELKRRTRVVGVFPNVASCERLIGALLVETDEEWQVEKKCYLNMDLLETKEPREAKKELSPAAA